MSYRPPGLPRWVGTSDGAALDDTYEHEVWNDTPSTRVVLFVDFVRPLRFPASSLNQLLLKLIGWSPYVQDGVENYKRWERKFDEMGREAANAA